MSGIFAGSVLSVCAMSCEGVRADHIPDKVNQFGTVGVMSIRLITACTGLPKDEVVYPEGLAKGARTDDVHCPWLEVHQDDTWHIASSSCFVEVDFDAL